MASTKYSTFQSIYFYCAERELANVLSKQIRLEKELPSQFSSVIIFRETKYMTINRLIITYNHNSRILRRAFDPGFLVFMVERIMYLP